MSDTDDKKDKESSLINLYNLFHKDRQDSHIHDPLPGIHLISPNKDHLISKDTWILGSYVVKSDPITGGMAKIWQLNHWLMNTKIAMKQPKAGYFLSQSNKENFFIECETWIKLGLNSHIVSCYYVRDLEGVPSVFSEWMPEGSLKDWIYPRGDKTVGRLYEGGPQSALERILDIAIQFARGLRYVHEFCDESGNFLGLVHQDVKPDNLLFTSEGEAKISDFGISRAMALLTRPDNDINEVQTVVSASGTYTPKYCSPEQRQGQTLTIRTDIYSWALSVLEMFLGDCQWYNGVTAGISYKSYLTMDKPVDIPDDMQILLGQCLNLSPDDRPKDFREIEERLLVTYKKIVGSSYTREPPKTASHTSGSLNNRALSFLDLGLDEEALKNWKKGLSIDPQNHDIIYNQALYLWRTAKITDLEALGRIETITKSTEPWLWASRMENIHDARGDMAERRSYMFMTENTYNQIVKKRREFYVENHIYYQRENFFEQSGVIASLCVSFDGSLAASASLDREIKVWDTSEKSVTKILKKDAHGNYKILNPDSPPLSYDYYPMSISSDNRYLLEGPEGNLWDLNLGERLGTLYVYPVCSDKYIRDISFSPVTMEWITSDSDGVIRFYSLETPGVLTRHFSHKFNSWTKIRLTPDAKNFVLYGESDKLVNFYDIYTFKLVKSFPTNGDNPSVAVSNDGSLLAVADNSHVINIFNVKTEECAYTYTYYKPCEISRFSPDDRFLVLTMLKQISLWDISNFRCMRTFEYMNRCDYHNSKTDFLFGVCYGDSVKFDDFPVFDKIEYPYAISDIETTSIRLAADNDYKKHFLLANDFLSKLDIASALKECDLARANPGYGITEDILRLNNRIGSFCSFKTLRYAWQEAVTPLPFKQSVFYEDINSDVFDFSPDCSLALCSDKKFGDFSQSLFLFNTNDGFLVGEFLDMNMPIMTVANVKFSQNGRFAATSNYLGISLWDLKSMEKIHFFDNISKFKKSSSIHFINDSEKILISYDGNITSLNISTGEVSYLYQTNKNLNLSVSDDGSLIMIFVPFKQSSLIKNKFIFISDSLYPDILQKISLNINHLTNVFMSNDKFTLFVHHDFKLSLYDINSEKLIWTIPHIYRPFDTILFFPNNKFLLISDRSSFILIVRADTGDFVAQYPLETPVKIIKISPDSQYIYTYGLGVIVRWRLDWEYEYTGVSS
jgi:serine/threonine protein kinase/WD40 repeat protein